MELIDHARVLRRHWLWLAGAVLLGAVLSTTWFIAAPRDYGATTRLLVSPTVTGSSADGNARAGESYVSNRLPSYAQLATSIGIATDVVTQLGLDLDPQDLAEHVTTYTPARTSLIEVRGEAGDARSAAALANATADRLGRAVQELETPYAGGVARVTVTVVRPASAGQASVSPSAQLTYGVGLVGGLVVGLLAATARGQAERGRADPPPVSAAATPLPVA